MNHLASEKSPYLLQHKDNPVDWYPWCAEAFQKAKESDKPIFLSIGYSTCHWCHVMAHESFEDPEVAEALNRDYICIKVDREERPDIDAVYMQVCQALTGLGGWPLTIVMTADQNPFFAGTYFPKGSHLGGIGLLSLLDAITDQWKNNRSALFDASEEVTALLQKSAGPSNNSEPSKDLLLEAVKQLSRSFDAKWGGFGDAPKFPTAHNLLFLLRHSMLEQDTAAREMAEKTLVQMYRGGIFDHIGGGFSRYSTDQKWLVPHFEKMLYDNALISLACLEAYRLTRRPIYQTIVDRTLQYIQRELTDKQGGFYCGQDADSDGVEGKYYVFTPKELQQLLGPKDGQLLCWWYGILEGGNFEGKSIPNLIENPDYEESSERIDALRTCLYDYRLYRTYLHRDDKILTSWNSLMITAFARAARILKKPEYLKAAIKAERFLRSHLIGNHGRLKIRWRDGEAAHEGQLDDYAFYSLALLELYESTFDEFYLESATDITEIMLKSFLDEQAGGFYLYSQEGETLICRPKETYDGAIPSGNSVAALVLGRLARLTGESGWQRASEKQLRFLAGEIIYSPAAHCCALLAFQESLYPSCELICTTAEDSPPVELFSFLQEHIIPNLTVLVKTSSNAESLAETAPFTANYPLPMHGSRYYLCRNGSCREPADDIVQLSEQFRTSLTNC